MTANSRQLQYGLTVVELLVTLAVALILLLIATPMFTSVTNNNRLTAASNLLSVHMQLARSEAIKRGNSVTICPTGDGHNCANSNQWGLGWMVFVDNATAGTVESGSGDEVIAVSPSVDQNVDISVSHTYIRYLPDGSIDLPVP